jgi:hypothetical protein
MTYVGIDQIVGFQEVCQFVQKTDENRVHNIDPVSV